MPATSSSLDDYANSMFRFEQLHDGWIDRCVAYLRYIFGARLQGKTVIDYAFGRGNWSVAFLRAGAAKVIAIDASSSNAGRFRSYCAQHGLSAIEVICGNVMEAPVNARGDILWLYGILPAIEEQERFLQAVLPLVAGADASVLAYGYNRHSLREFIVEKARAEIIYPSEAAFRAESLRYTPAARMRARDDLTAPHVEWHGAASMASLFRPLGFAPVAQFDDFRFFDHHYSGEEFAPVHLLLERNPAAPIAPKEPPQPFAKDIVLLNSLWESLLPFLSPDERKALAITGFNTHFSHLGSKGEPKESIVQLYLLLLYGLRSKGVTPQNAPSALAGDLIRLGEEAIAQTARTPIAGIQDTFLVRYLNENTVRI